MMVYQDLNRIMLMTTVVLSLATLNCHASPQKTEIKSQENKLKETKTIDTASADTIEHGIMGINWGEQIEVVKKRIPDLLRTDSKNHEKDIKKDIPYKRTFGDTEVFGISCENIIYYFTENKFSMIYCATGKKSKKDSQSDAKKVYSTFSDILGNVVSVSDANDQKNMTLDKRAKWEKGDIAAEITVADLPGMENAFGFYCIKNKLYIAERKMP